VECPDRTVALALVGSTVSTVPNDAYRDELAAANARIAQLEQIVAAQGSDGVRQKRIAALVRERGMALQSTEPPNVWRMLRWMFIVFPCTGVAFVVDRDWVVGGLAIVLPFVIGSVGQRIANGNAAAAQRQVALIDAQIGQLEKTEGT